MLYRQMFSGVVVQNTQVPLLTVLKFISSSSIVLRKLTPLHSEPWEIKCSQHSGTQIDIIVAKLGSLWPELGAR